MPIRAEMKAKYPADWKAISRRIRFERAGNRCETCGAENGRAHPVTGSKVVLTVAHLNHDPADCRDENLAALCQRDHLAYDAAEHAKSARATAARKRAASAVEAGQGALALGGGKIRP